jgi:hypothetical protein
MALGVFMRSGSCVFSRHDAISIFTLLLPSSFHSINHDVSSGLFLDETDAHGHDLAGRWLITDGLTHRILTNNSTNNIPSEEVITMDSYTKPTVVTYSEEELLRLYEVCAFSF